MTDSAFFGVGDLLVRETVIIYGRTFHLVDADAFTRAYVAETLAVELEQPLPYPDDPIEAYRRAFPNTTDRSHTGTSKDASTADIAAAKTTLTLEKFLENSRKVGPHVHSQQTAAAAADGWRGWPPTAH